MAFEDYRLAYFRLTRGIESYTPALSCYNLSKYQSNTLTMQVEEKKPLLEDKEMSPQDFSSPNHVDEKREDVPEEETNEDNKSKETERDVPIRTRDIGIWRVFYQDNPWSFLPGVDTARRLKEVVQAIPFVWRFLKDVWGLAPGYLVLWALLSVWEALEGAMSLWVTAQMLQTVSVSQRMWKF